MTFRHLCGSSHASIGRLLPLAALGGDRRLRVATLLLSGYLIATGVTYQVV